MSMGMSFFILALKGMDFIRSTCMSFFIYAPGPDPPAGWRAGLAYNG
jgi:hypothetical protein